MELQSLGKYASGVRKMASTGQRACDRAQLRRLQYYKPLGGPVCLCSAVEVENGVSNRIQESDTSMQQLSMFTCRLRLHHSTRTKGLVQRLYSIVASHTSRYLVLSTRHSVHTASVFRVRV